jgi:hypothetical protein
MMVVIVIRRLGEIGAFTSADRFVARCGAAPNEVHLIPQDLPTLYFGQPMPQPRHLHGDPHPNSLQQVTRVAAPITTVGAYALRQRCGLASVELDAERGSRSENDRPGRTTQSQRDRLIF